MKPHSVTGPNLMCVLSFLCPFCGLPNKRCNCYDFIPTSWTHFAPEEAEDTVHYYLDTKEYNATGGSEQAIHTYLYAVGGILNTHTTKEHIAAAEDEPESIKQTAYQIPENNFSPLQRRAKQLRRVYRKQNIRSLFMNGLRM